MGKDILNIYCPSCGAPANFDIVRQVYRCSYCGSKVEIEEARQAHKSMQSRRRKKIRDSAKEFALMSTSCTGCGATLVFEENEAISNCEFCGRSLVRKRYSHRDEVPQGVIPFAVTKEEAAEKLEEWCRKNRHKPEARHLRPKISQIQGYYLPYEMVRGPVHCRVSKKGSGDVYEADGFLNDEFINCSRQLDNLVLDAMEPYDLDGLEEFDFAFVAGHKVKVADIDEDEAAKRLRMETDRNYRSAMETIWGTRAISLIARANAAVTLPVLLPVYYISDGNVHAAVNGQTGKVCVRAEKESVYISLPWWLKGICILLLACGLTFGALWLGTGDPEGSLLVMGMLGLFYLIVFACMFEPGDDNRGSIVKYRNIFTSGEETFRREQGRLVLREEALKRKIAEPVFMLELDGVKRPVSYLFRSPKRSAFAVLLSIGTIFLPVILALIINGFNFAKLNLGGSAVWFCITVPVVPIYLIRFGVQWLYDSPWIYVFDEAGEKKRYRKKIKVNADTIRQWLKIGLGCLITPPICFVVWVFFLMVYFTAFGF